MPSGVSAGAPGAIPAQGGEVPGDARGADQVAAGERRPRVDPGEGLEPGVLEGQLGGQAREALVFPSDRTGLGLQAFQPAQRGEQDGLEPNRDGEPRWPG
jgi:hypothetical protein